jgi:hypothetical protein
VSRQALQLFADGHDPDGITGPGRTTNPIFKLLLITCGRRGLLYTLKKALA